MIVLDTSATAELLLNLPLGDAVRERLASAEASLHAPHLLVIEMLQVLRRRTAAGMTGKAAALLAIDLLDDLDVSYYDHRPLAPRVWELRENLTAYDAAYVALAEVLGATLVTTDARLARSPGNRATVDLVGG